MQKRAIVLSGGGSCGAYQIGVWKALRKLKIDYHIVTGTSVGALNGIMMVQKDFHLAYKIWSNLDYKLLFKSFIDADDKKITNKDVYMQYVDGFLKNGGMDITNLELTIANIINDKKFWSSPIEFGVVVFNLSKLQPESFTKENLNSDNVKDYIIASASCYPAIKTKTINEQKYIDGGYGDNLPVNLAISLGATEIIAVDLEQIGIKKKIKEDNIQIKYIRPNNDVGSFLIFEKEQAQKNIKYGYNDTLKIYGKLKGNIFTFCSFGYNHFIRKISKLFKKNLKSLSLKIFLTNNYNELKTKNLKEKVVESMEFLGKILKLDDTKIYFWFYYNQKIKMKFKNIPPLDRNLIKKKIEEKDIKSLLGSEYIVKYIYMSLEEEKNGIDLKLLFHLFPKEFMAAIYLICIQ